MTANPKDTVLTTLTTARLIARRGTMTSETITRRSFMSDPPNDTALPREREWLTVTEAAEVTGYNKDHVRLLARNQDIVAEITPNGYMIYMPDLWRYIEEVGYGPHQSKEEAGNDEH